MSWRLSSTTAAILDKGKGRGKDIRTCRGIQMEMGWNPDLPSNSFDMKPASTLNAFILKNAS